MDKSIIVIPCWRREDFLQMTLDCIVAAKNADKNFYVFSVDRNFHMPVVDVAKKFPFEKTIHFTPQHRYRGNSYNVLEGYRLAVRLAKQKHIELIHLIEEDIAVSKDYFDFHSKVQSKYNCFCCSAVRNQNNNISLPDEPESIYYHDSYQSLGVSFKISHLEKILTHANINYYGNMSRYLATRFPKSRHKNHFEQDGLIDRILETSPDKAIYPFVARGHHFGFVGYNRRGKALEGNLEERVAKLKTMTDAEMNDLAMEYKDITSCNLEGHRVEEYTIKSF